MITSRLLPSVFLILTLAGCGAVGTGLEQINTKTVSWYLAHGDELKTQMALCRDNPGQLAVTPNCINASQASLQSQMHSKYTAVPY